ncbi:MAG TPA: hypothetical protein VHW02_14375 [Rhizomicrobium sp.]|jgi:protein ImuA|nr:hypothetical protein [Rhizomicrobium sp.]
MAHTKENLAVLRAFLEKPALEHSASETIAPLDGGPVDAALRGGLRRGALHEVFAAGAGEETAATGFALALAARAIAKGKWLLWVRQDFSALETGEIHGAGFAELGIDPSRVLHVRTPDATAALRAGAEGLDCKGLGAVIIEPWAEPKVFDLIASRRLTLAAQQHGVTAIVLRFNAEPEASAAETRWRIKSANSPPNAEDWGNPRFDAALIRNRHGNNGHWIMEWDCNNGIFQTHCERLAAAAADRPAEAPVAGLRQAG